MPEWGLTRAQIKAKPWGLARAALSPCKKITDPIHGEIYLTTLEVAVLDSGPMQRLRRVRQLGTTHLVYPGATHTRFSHSLGALRSAQDLMDVVIGNGLGPHPVNDLFGEWRSPGTAGSYDQMVGEATVLARLGALLHDLCHVPFGHTVEEDLGILERHDGNEHRYEKLWPEVLADLQLRSDLVPGGIALPDELNEQLKPLILSQSEDAKSIDQRYPFVADIVGNTICADLIDYLQRDHLQTGLPAGFGHRFLDGFYVTRSDHPSRPKRMVIQINRDGELRADVVSELLKYLRYRYELSERVLVHHAKLAADVMIGKVFELWRDALQSESDAESAVEEMESQVLRWGDDGLLEYLLDEAGRHPENDRWEGLARIASDLQRRKLFKPIGTYSRRAMASSLYMDFGSREARAAVEEDAATYAGAELGWMVALWIPDPAMRFKAAEVLVDDGGETEIVDLEAWDGERGHRGSEIIESHHGLWAVRVYADSSLTDEQRDVVLDRLQSKLGINGWNGSHRTRAELAAERVGADKHGLGMELAELERLAEELLPHQATFESLVEALSARVMSSHRQGLEAWRGRGLIDIEHPELEALINSTTDSRVTLDGVTFDVAVERDVVRLNLSLFVRELPEALATSENLGRIRKIIDDSPGDLEDRFVEERAVSSAARRADPTMRETNPQTLAFEVAVRGVLGMTGDQRLFE